MLKGINCLSKNKTMNLDFEQYKAEAKHKPFHRVDQQEQMDFFSVAVEPLVHVHQENRKNLMVVNMRNNHVQCKDTPQRHPGEWAHRRLVLQDSVSCNSLVLVCCNKRNSLTKVMKLMKMTLTAV